MKSDRLKVVVIDDDANARQVLRVMLEEWATEVELLGEAEDVPSGVRLIQKIQPDLVFLDVEMPNYSGLQLLEFFNPEDIDFKIVFCTAFSEYALQAFRMSAVDYLLKPLQWSEVEAAIQKTRAAINQDWAKEQLLNLRDNLKNEKRVNKIALPVSDGFLFMPLDKLSHVEASGSYADVYDAQGQRMIVSRKIKELEEILQGDKRFLRVHRSFIINLDFIQKYVRQDGGYVLMENGAQVPISREYRDELMDLLSAR